LRVFVWAEVDLKVQTRHGNVRMPISSMRVFFFIRSLIKMWETFKSDPLPGFVEEGHWLNKLATKIA
jgi:hypothetical protein